MTRAEGARKVEAGAVAEARPEAVVRRSEKPGEHRARTRRRHRPECLTREACAGAVSPDSRSWVYFSAACAAAPGAEHPSRPRPAAGRTSC